MPLSGEGGSFSAQQISKGIPWTKRKDNNFTTDRIINVDETGLFFKIQ